MNVTEDGTIKNLSSKEADRLYKAIKDILAGELTVFSHDVFSEWCKESGLNNSLLVKSTVFPQKAQQAIIEHYREELGYSNDRS